MSSGSGRVASHGSMTIMTRTEPVSHPATTGRCSQTDFDTNVNRLDCNVGVDQIASPAWFDCCSVAFPSAPGDMCLRVSRVLDEIVREHRGVPAPPPCGDTPGPRPDFSVAISRDRGMFVVAIHSALSPTSAAQLRQILLDLVDHLPTGNGQ